MAIALLADSKHVYPCGAFGVKVVRRCHAGFTTPSGLLFAVQFSQASMHKG